MQKTGRLAGIALCAFATTSLAVPPGGGHRPEELPAPRTSAPGDADWPSFNQKLDGNRFSALDQLNTGTVNRLQEVCRVPIGQAGSFNPGPVMLGGIVYVTSGRATLAIDAANCTILWKALYAPRHAAPYEANRGVAVADGKVFRGTGDGRLMALDAQTGEKLWDVPVGDAGVGEFISSAPIAWNGKVFVGLSGGDWGIQGRMMAFDAATGKMLWTFNTVPHPGEPGNETWPGDTWQKGGGGTWSSYTLDTKTGDLFVPVANPAPDLNAAIRRGDNLYTNSIVVLDAETGKLRWYLQTRKNDNHDYGVTVPAVLAAGPNGGRIVVQGAKDGYVYGVDRASHTLIYKTAVTTIANHDTDATPEGVRVCPGLTGGVEYNSPGYDPGRQLMVVGSVDWCSLIKSGPPDYKPGDTYLSGTWTPIGTGGGWITALDAPTGKIRWKVPTRAPMVAGITPTAGGLTLAGDMAGTFYMIRTADGTVLRRIDTQGAIAGGVITYQLSGTQYVALTSGNVSRSTWPMATGKPSLVIYALGAANSAAAAAPAKAVAPSKPDALTATPLGRQFAQAAAANPAHGKQVFANVCAGCHGSSGEGGAGPKLQGIGTRRTQTDLVAFVKKPTPPMPTFYPGTVSAQDVTDVVSYVRTLK